MVTEEQKKLFNGKLGVVLDIENINISDENRKKHIKWLQNVYYKYLNNTLPEEHKKDLEDNLKRRNITREEFLETKGNLDMFVALYKSKEEVEKPKEETIEDLEKLQNELNEAISKLSKKHTPKGKNLYHLTDEEYNEIGKQIAELEEKKKEISKKLSEKTPKEEIKEEKVTSNAQKKIEELIVTNKQKDAEIVELKNELAKQREERAFYSNKYREEYERQLAIYSKQKDEEIEEKVKEEVRKQISKTTQKDEENKIIQKKHITNLLLTENIVSLDDIKIKLKTINCPTTKLDIALNEVMNEIPGTMKVLNSNGQIEYYSLCSSAVNKLEALRKIEVCPKLTNVMTGMVKFAAFADFHVPLNSKSDEIKKVINPLFEYSSANKNLALIDLGDDADTLKDIDYSRWQNQDKEAAKQAYNFFKKFGKVISECPDTKLFYKPGNHGEHSYLVGIDPIEILNSCANNIVFLGSGKSSVMIGDEKLGIFHGIDSVPYGERKKFTDYSQHICEEIAKRLQQLAKDYFYSLIAHYHFAEHRPFEHFSIIGHSIKCPVVFTAVLEDGQIKKMYAQNLVLSKNQNTYIEDSYRTLVYDCNYKIKKIGH